MAKKILKENIIKEEWAHFEYEDGSNSYIAKTEKEKERILKKYKDSVEHIKDHFYIIHNKPFNIEDYYDIELEDGKSVYGGIAFDGETVRDFVADMGFVPKSLKVLNNHLIASGIKPLEEMRLREGEDSAFNEEEWCVRMIQSIIAYGPDFKSGEELVKSEEDNANTLYGKNYLKGFIDNLGREKVVELAQQQLDRPHRIHRGVITDSDGLSYNTIDWDINESLEKGKVVYICDTDLSVAGKTFPNGVIYKIDNTDEKIKEFADKVINGEKVDVKDYNGEEVVVFEDIEDKDAVGYRFEDKKLIVDFVSDKGEESSKEYKFDMLFTNQDETIKEDLDKQELYDGQEFSYKNGEISPYEFTFELWYLDGENDYAIACNDIVNSYDNTPAYVGSVSVNGTKEDVMNIIKERLPDLVKDMESNGLEWDINRLQIIYIDELYDLDIADTSKYEKLMNNAKTEEELKDILEKAKSEVVKCPEGYEKFCGYLNDPYQKIEIGTELIDSNGEHFYVTDVDDMDNQYAWVSRSEADVETGKGRSLSKDRIAFVKLQESLKEGLTDDLERLYNAIISKDKKEEEKLRKGLERLGMDRFTQNTVLKELHKKKNESLNEEYKEIKRYVTKDGKELNLPNYIEIDANELNNNYGCDIEFEDRLHYDYDKVIKGIDKFIVDNYGCSAKFHIAFTQNKVCVFNVEWDATCLEDIDAFIRDGRPDSRISKINNGEKYLSSGRLPKNIKPTSLEECIDIALKYKDDYKYAVISNCSTIVWFNSYEDAKNYWENECMGFTLWYNVTNKIEVVIDLKSGDDITRDVWYDYVTHLRSTYFVPSEIDGKVCYDFKEAVKSAEELKAKLGMYGDDVPVRGKCEISWYKQDDNDNKKWHCAVLFVGDGKLKDVAPEFVEEVIFGKPGNSKYSYYEKTTNESLKEEVKEDDNIIAKKCDEIWDNLVSNSDEVHLYDYNNLITLEDKFEEELRKNKCDLSFKTVISPKYGFKFGGNCGGIASSYINHFTTGQWKECSMSKDELEAYLKKDIKTYKSSKYFSVQEISKQEFMNISFGSSSRNVGYGSQSSTHIESTELKQDKFGNLLAEHSYLIYDSLIKEEVKKQKYGIIVVPEDVKTTTLEDAEEIVKNLGMTSKRIGGVLQAIGTADQVVKLIKIKGYDITEKDVEDAIEQPFSAVSLINEEEIKEDVLCEDYSSFLANFGFDYLKGVGDFEYWYFKDREDKEGFQKAVERIRQEYPKMVVSSGDSVGRPYIYIQKSKYLKESLEDNATYVIYTENGKLKGTPISNYNAEIRDANMIQDFSSFKKPEDVIDYLIKYTPYKDISSYKVINEDLDYNKVFKDAYSKLDNEEIRFNVDKDTFEFIDLDDTDKAEKILTDLFGEESIARSGFDIKVRLNEGFDMGVFDRIQSKKDKLDNLINKATEIYFNEIDPYAVNSNPFSSDKELISKFKDDLYDSDIVDELIAENKTEEEFVSVLKEIKEILNNMIILKEKE